MSDKKALHWSSITDWWIDTTVPAWRRASPHSLVIATGIYGDCSIKMTRKNIAKYSGEKYKTRFVNLCNAGIYDLFLIFLLFFSVLQQSQSTVKPDTGESWLEEMNRAKDKAGQNIVGKSIHDRRKWAPTCASSKIFTKHYWARKHTDLQETMRRTTPNELSRVVRWMNCWIDRKIQPHHSDADCALVEQDPEL